MDLARLAEQAAARLGERRTLHFEGEWHTNLETLDRARRLQRSFSELGLGPGRIAALCVANHPSIARRT